jgi:glycosyltransferase involved in cell wall biosynthesis
MKFSVITPSFNQGRFLRDCLESVRTQVHVETRKRGKSEEYVDTTLSHFKSSELQDFFVEHIVMDGGSTDETLSILKDWESVTSHPQPAMFSFHFMSEADKGQTDAINKGLKQATGDLLAYLCSDDLYEPEALKEVAKIFMENPAVDVVYGDYFFLEGDSGWKRFKKAGKYSRGRLLKTNFLGQPAVFWRRRVYEKSGGLDVRLRFCMDHEYWLRISSNTKWAYLPKPLATCRLHASAKTSSQLTSAWWETAEMVKPYGQGCRFYWKAFLMQILGQWIYGGKRFLFQSLGNKVRFL